MNYIRMVRLQTEVDEQLREGSSRHTVEKWCILHGFSVPEIQAEPSRGMVRMTSWMPKKVGNTESFAIDFYFSSDMILKRRVAFRYSYDLPAEIRLPEILQQSQ